MGCIEMRFKDLYLQDILVGTYVNTKRWTIHADSCSQEGKKRFKIWFEAAHIEETQHQGLYAVLIYSTRERYPFTPYTRK
jgi:hypothetical protein